MCLSPVNRPNPWYDPSVHASSRVQSLVHKVGTGFFKPETAYIASPCGVCAECVQARQNAFVQRAEIESRFNHIFFCTLTYDDKHLPHFTAKLDVSPEPINIEPVERSFDYDDAYLDLCDFDLTEHSATQLIWEDDYVWSEPDLYGSRHLESVRKKVVGHIPPVGVDRDDNIINVDNWEEECCLDSDSISVSIPYAEVHDIQLLFKRLRDNLMILPEFSGRSLKYMAVSELGKEHGRPHFHILFFVSKLESDYIKKWEPGKAPKHAGSQEFKPSVLFGLERLLYDKVKEFWSVNVGTRKNPIYEPRFEHHTKISGNKVYTNYELHYVDPAGTDGGTLNVAYYVGKYALKDSPWEKKRKAFCYDNMLPERAFETWNKIKSRLLLSKGFGLNAVYVHASDVVRKCEKRRLMVPDWRLCEELRVDSIKDAGKQPFAIYINKDGKHVPLAQYYKRRPEVFGYYEFAEIQSNLTQEMLDKQYNRLDNIPELDKKIQKRKKRFEIMAKNSSFEDGLKLGNLNKIISNPVYNVRI